MSLYKDVNNDYHNHYVYISDENDSVVHDNNGKEYSYDDYKYCNDNDVNVENDNDYGHNDYKNDDCAC